MIKPTSLASRPPQPTYRKIATGLREQILSGKLAPGQQLRSKGELIATWKGEKVSPVLLPYAFKTQ